MDNAKATKPSNLPSLISRMKLKFLNNQIKPQNYIEKSSTIMTIGLPTRNVNFVPVLQKKPRQIVVVPNNNANFNFQRPLSAHEYKSTPNINTLINNPQSSNLFLNFFKFLKTNIKF